MERSFFNPSNVKNKNTVMYSDKLKTLIALMVNWIGIRKKAIFYKRKNVF